MIKKTFFFLLFSFYALAIEIDPQVLQEIINTHKQAYKEKILLAKYYEKHDKNTKALQLVKEILHQRPKEKNTLKLYKKLQKKQYIKEIFQKAKLSYPIIEKKAEKRLNTYYIAHNYQFYITLYQALLSRHIRLKDTYHIKASSLYMWHGDYISSITALQRVKNKNTINVKQIQANICYHKGDYSCASKLFEQSYTQNYQLSNALKLIQSYIYLNNLAQAKKVYRYTKRKSPQSTKLQALHIKIEQAKKNTLQKLQKRYKTHPTFTTLQPYTIALNEIKKTQKALQVLHHFNQTHATQKSLILEAKYLLWSGDTTKASDILKAKSLKNNLEAHYMLGQIYSWTQQLQKAHNAFHKVLTHTQDKKLLYKTRKALAFVYKWENNTQKAQQLLQQLQKENPLDNEVKVALMQLNHNYVALIKIYKKQLDKNPKNHQIRYNYAYNLMKNHEFQKAKKVFLLLKKNTFYPLDKHLNHFITSWKEAWQSKNFQKYSKFYTTDFKENTIWSVRKKHIFSKTKSIKVILHNPTFKQLYSNTYLIRFYQEYITDKKSDKGYKTLQVQCDRTKNSCKIIKEQWKASKYKKAPLLSLYIDNALKEIKNRKKKTLLNT